MNISESDFQSAARRCALDGVPINVQRFENDRLSTRQFVERISTAFCGNASDEVRAGDCHAHPPAPLAAEYDDAPERDDDPARIALARVVAFFKADLAKRFNNAGRRAI